MTQYAAKTSVPPSRSRDEINATLRRFGAKAFRYYEDDERATIGFSSDYYDVAISLPMTGTRQEVASRWRTLALAIKAKLSLIECGGSTFEREFFANITLPSGATVFETFGAKLQEVEAGVIETRVVALPERAR